MAETEENRGKRSLSMQMNGFSRDLLHKFMNGNNFKGKLQQIPPNENREDEDDIELSLGLSLNGRFGVDPERAKRLKRSSSINNVVFTNGEDSNNSRGFPFGSYATLARTCSLPVETEEECRKRKEIQSLRRLEAKRKRWEKLQNVRVVKDTVDLEENREENGNGCSNGQGSVGNIINGNNENSLPLSQGSMGSQGSGSSGISDLGSQPIQGASDCTGTNIPSSVKSAEQEHEQKPIAAQPETTSEQAPSICNGNASKETKEMFKNFMLNMPCVSTKGDGPNGKKVDGFLYRYKKGEEVRIVCVCHGNFLSPAEFVKHAGGSDVANPLKHIVVNPAPLMG
ncbi:PREDICTED: ninja-family protein AFP3-like [Nicotiana attenuata]|uniref:Ninja-family protein n=1 Tax=Nicotiana attenuata TaxID=49451 RepID=A0A1J6IL09_NICAT|nr:PREDICTED: ninja-family protein AFP3-like [Nicotiana attenuata]OIT05821.1 ninja-family protein afp3 [Nicotiana attenuata]